MSYHPHHGKKHQVSPRTPPRLHNERLVAATMRFKDGQRVAFTMPQTQMNFEGVIESDGTKVRHKYGLLHSLDEVTNLRHLDDCPVEPPCSPSKN